MWQEDWRFTDLGTDLAQIKLRFDATTHESKTDEEKYRKVQELITLANQTPDDRFVEVHRRRGSTSRASSASSPRRRILGDTDGFLGAFGMNNFYLYRLENQDKHVLIAWDTDNTFWGPTFPIRPRRHQRADAEADAHPRIQRAVVPGDRARQRSWRKPTAGSTPRSSATCS